MGSNGLPPNKNREVPSSIPAPLPSSKRKVVDGTECVKADPINTLIAFSMITMDFSMLGFLDLQRNESEGSIDE